MKKTLLTVAYFCIFIFLFAQENKLQSLFSDINKTSSEENKTITIENAYLLLEENPDSLLKILNYIVSSNPDNNNISLIELKFLQIKALNSTKQYKQALNEIAGCDSLFFKDKNNKWLAECLYEKGFALYYSGSNDSAMTILNRSFQIAGSNNELKLQAQINRIQALIYWSRGNYPEGLIQINKAVNYFKEIQDSINLAESLNTKGAIQWGLANYENALQNFYDALVIENNFESRIGRRIILYNNIGMVHSDWGNLEKSLEFYQKAEQLLNETQNTTAFAYTYLCLGSYYVQTKEFEKALSYLNLAQQNYEKLNDLNGVSFCKIRKGQCYIGQQKHVEAQQMLTNALKDTEITRNNHRRALALFQMAKNQIQLADKVKAHDFNTESIKLSVAGKYRDLLYLLYVQAAEIQEGLFNYEDAISYYKKANSEKDEIYREKTAVQFEILEVILENNQKEFENISLKEQNDIREKTIMYGAFFIVIIVILLFIISGALLTLSKKKKELQRANAGKDKIFSILAHDLRGPVGNLNNFIDLMIADDDIDYKAILTKFKPQIAHSHSLLENLLAWAKSNLGNIKIQKENVSLNKLIRDNVSLLSNAANNKNISIHYFSPNEIMVWTDPMVIQTVLRNLISNAMKFTKSGGKIEISLQTTGKTVQVEVKDNGQGIPQSIQNDIFKGTYNTVGTHNEKGSGLGLMLCKELLEKNEGSIWFHSEINVGTSFFFTIPLSEK